MKKFSNLKLFGLLIFLSVALVLVGVNFLEADKPDKKLKPHPKEEATWTVAIPGENSGYNLYGLPLLDEYNIYQVAEEPRVDVTVEKKGGGKGPETQLRLTIWYSILVHENGDRWAECIIDGPKIGFQNLALTLFPDPVIVWEEFPCFFPNYKEFIESFNGGGECYPCDNPGEVALFIPHCMQHFLEEYSHPYCDTLCSEYSDICSTNIPNCIYQYVDIVIAVDYDIEKIEDIPVSPSGQVWIKTVNNYNLQTGCEDWHNVSGLLKRDNSEGCITIARLGPDTWEITVDTIAVNKSFTFNEIYKGHWRNRWEYKIPYWAQTPLKFITKWTRQEVE